MNALNVLQQARQLGLTLERNGEKLSVSPASKCPPEFVATLREHKGEILEILATELPPDQAPWLHTAKQVILGDWEGVGRSTRESLIIGLRGVNHPLCKAALARLAPNTKANQ